MSKWPSKIIFINFSYLILTLFGCQSGMVPVSQRDYNKGDGVLHAKAGSRQRDEDGERLYRKNPEVVIDENGEGSVTGSLFKADDKRNNVFTDKDPNPQHHEMTIIVDSTRLKKKGGEEKKPTTGPAAPPAAGKDGKPSPDELEKALLSMAPQLDGGDKNPEIITEFKMKFLRRTSTGDVIARYQRESVNDQEVNRIDVTARIPYDKTLPGEVISTNDLLDVAFNEDHNGDKFERSSVIWEDEYSLRMSGFSEAKSKAALELEGKKRDLEKVRTQLDTRVKNLTKERTQVAKERDRVGKKEAELDQKFKELNEKIEQQNKVIEEQNKKLQEAKATKLQDAPSENPPKEATPPAEVDKGSVKPLDSKPGEQKGKPDA